MKKEQEKKFAPNLRTWEIVCENAHYMCIHASNCRLTPDQVRELAKYLNEWIDNCNVAIKQIVPKSALFDSCSDPNVYTLEVNEQLLQDFQKMRKSPGEDMRKTIIALMDFYSDHESLNIILMGDVLEKRQSYVRFTAQLANFLTHGQTNFTQCKVQFDNLTSRLGIFCRKGTEKSSLNSTFLGSVTAALRAYGSAQVDMADIPMSYVGNRAALKHQLTKRIGRTPRIVWDKDSVKIYDSKL
jgi:hypothetical protein